MFRSISLVLATACVSASFSDARAADRITDAPFATRSEVIAPHAMAATSQPLATQIALDVMKQGGSAVDAAIAADAALGLMGDGEGPAKGQMWTNPNLAGTYDAIARLGRDGFYKGEIAQRIADYMKRQGGYLDYDDLAAHHGEWVEPVSVNYRGYDVWELPPNCQGIAALEALNILEAYDLHKFGFGSPEHVHLVVEALKLAFAARAKLYADPDFVKTPVQALLDKSYARDRASLIQMERAMKQVASGELTLKGKDTIYLTTADPEGNMVSLIQSNYVGMGSGMAPEGLGFILQDRGQQFSLEPGHANVYAPGKRPFHTIIPAFITKDGAPWVSFGVMGGDMQPQGHVQIVINLIDFGMNLQEAGDAPRIYWETSQQPTGGVMTDGGKVNLESGFSETTLHALQLKRHVLGRSLWAYGGYQAIQRLPCGVWAGASESRKDGQAAGY
jgi:gamma-glutamyltranspeptidase / glutathione hydrolase